MSEDKVPYNADKKDLRTIDIKGKQYVMVSERIKAFNEAYINGCIKTEIHSVSNGEIIIKAFAIPDISIPDKFFTGHAYEKETSSYINKTSFVENCETSAIGRALGAMGIGIIDSVASADEVVNAINNQPEKASNLAAKETFTPNPKTYPSKKAITNTEERQEARSRINAIMNQTGMDEAYIIQKVFPYKGYKGDITKLKTLNDISDSWLKAKMKDLNKMYKEEVEDKMGQETEIPF